MRKPMMPTRSTIVLAALLTAACTTPAPRMESNLGHAVSDAKMRQTLNPKASADTRDVNGLGGAPASESIVRYHDSFKAPPPTFVVINPGGGGGQ
jgi:hypothetical protein